MQFSIGRTLDERVKFCALLSHERNGGGRRRRCSGAKLSSHLHRHLRNVATCTDVWSLLQQLQLASPAYELRCWRRWRRWRAAFIVARPHAIAVGLAVDLVLPQPRGRRVLQPAFRIVLPIVLEGGLVGPGWRGLRRRVWIALALLHGRGDGVGQHRGGHV